MIRLLSLISLLFLSFVHAGFGQTKKIALVIGINDYQMADNQNIDHIQEAYSRGKDDNPFFRNGFSDLYGAVNDAKAVRSVLINSFGFETDDIVLLTNQEASRARIFEAIEHHLIANSDRNTQVFFYYAGHGSQVRNPLSNELNKMDETIVPADHLLGTPDIRDKELRYYFNQILDKGAKLNVIFDSCHSGSIARNALGQARSRKFEAARGYISDDSYELMPSPEDRGALIISAAQDFQPALETIGYDYNFHGAFTNAFLLALKQASDSEPVAVTFRRLKARMQMNGEAQEPVLGCIPERAAEPFFLGSTAAGHKNYVVCENVLSEKSIRLQGGTELMLTEESVLRSVGTSEPVLIKINAPPSLSSSKASLLSGDISQIGPGTLFEIEHFGSYSHAPLNVAFQEVDISKQNIDADLIAIRTLLMKAQATMFSVLETLPYEKLGRLHVNDGQWTIDLDNRTIDLGKVGGKLKLSKKDAQELSGATIIPLPPISHSTAMELNMQSLLASRRVHLSTLQFADYTLVPVVSSAQVKYGWARLTPNKNGVLPSFTQLTTKDSELRNQLEVLQKIHYWSHLESPGEVRFPYKLVLFSATDTVALANHHLASGAKYGLMLYPQEMAQDIAAKQQFTYVFMIDGSGASTLLFPRRGNVENYYPLALNEEGVYPAVPLTNDRFISVTDEFDRNLLIMLTTDVAMADPSVLEFKGVAESNAVDFNTMMEKSSARSVAGRTSWSVQKMFFTSGEIDSK